MQRSIWNDRFWLPLNVTWNDFQQAETRGIAMPKVSDLVVVYPLALTIYLARLAFEYLLAQPIGRWFGIRDVKKSAHHVSPLAKFSESTWRFTFYLGIFLYGLVVLRNVKRPKKTNRFSVTNDFSCRKAGGRTRVTVGSTIPNIR